MTHRLVTFGEGLALVHATQIGSLAHLGQLRLSTGGAEANVAIGVTRLGVPATWLGRLGRDSLGERVARELRAEGIDTRVLWDDDAPTGLMVKEWPRSGRTNVLYYRSGSAGSRLQPADVEQLDLDSACLLHVTGITPALSDSAAQAVTRAVSLARERGVAVSFDLNHREKLWRGRDPRPTYRALAESATVLFAGVDEARLIAGDADADPETLARQLSALGPAEVVIKLGAAGALAVIEGAVVHQPATAVSVVDTVGAGDALVAAYLARRCQGAEPAQRLAAGVRAGALACTGPGDWEGLPRLAELAADCGPGDEPVSR